MANVVTSVPEEQLADLAAKLRELRLSPWMAARLNAERVPNFWSIIEYGKGSYEIRYSKMLRWLLDPTANHGLGAFMLRWIANAIDFSDPAKPQSVDWSKGAEGDFDVNSYHPNDYDGAETEALGKRIDVFAHDQANGICLVVEVKMGIDEHDSTMKGESVSQLEKYWTAVMDHPEYGSDAYGHRYFVFLTEDGHIPPSFASNMCSVDSQDDWKRSWKTMSYKQLHMLLDQALLHLTSADASKLVRDFAMDVRRHSDYGDDKQYAPFEQYAMIITQLDEYFNGDTGDEEESGKSKKNEDGDDSAQYHATRKIGNDFIVALSKESVPVDDAKMMINNLCSRFTTTKQDHTTNPDVQLLVRRVFNRFAANELDLSDPTVFGSEPKEARLSPVKPELAYTGVTGVELTQGKGQGISICFGDLDEDKKTRRGTRIYLSGDNAGTFPNDPWAWIHNETVKDTPGRRLRGRASDLLANETQLWTIVDAWIQAMNNAIS